MLGSLIDIAMAELNVSNHELQTILIPFSIFFFFSLNLTINSYPPSPLPTINPKSIYLQNMHHIHLLIKYAQKNYFRDPWNSFDFIIVFGSITDIIYSELNVSLNSSWNSI